MSLKVPVVAERCKDGVWALIIVRCPYCGKRHQHGGGNGEQPYFGGRLSHCLENERDYELVCAQGHKFPAPAPEGGN